MNSQPKERPNGQAPQISPYAFYVAVIAMGSACLVYFLSMWASGDLFEDPSTVLGSLFTRASPERHRVDGPNDTGNGAHSLEKSAR